jgi:3-oxoacyl-(acyl-carrier-protein) synthase
MPHANKQQPARRVVITGRGFLLPFGNDRQALLRWVQGEPAPSHIAGFRAADYISNQKVLRAMQRAFGLAACAAVLAMREAKLDATGSVTTAGYDAERAGTAVAMNDFSPLTPDLLRIVHETSPDGVLNLARFADAAMHQLHPFRRLSLLVNMAAAHVSLLFGLQGPSFTFNSGVDAGSHAIREAFWTIAEGRADLMLCEAADAPDLATDPGQVLEAGASLVLEELAHAERRGASVLAELYAGDMGSVPAMYPANNGATGRQARASWGLLCALAKTFSIDHRPSLASASRVELEPIEPVPLVTAGL